MRVETGEVCVVTLQSFYLGRAEGVAVGGVIDRRLYELLPGQTAQPLVHTYDAGYGTGYAAGEVTQGAQSVGDVTQTVQVHVTVGSGRGGLAVI